MQCIMILLRSYSKSFIIGGVVSLVGIGICFILEQRWRNTRQASSGDHLEQSACVKDQTTTNEMETDNPRALCERLVLNEDYPTQVDSADELLNSSITQRTEDDVTYLFGCLSNMTVGDKSSPGLPWITINLNNLTNQSGNLTLLEDSVENFGSQDILSTVLESDVDTEDDSKEFCSTSALEFGLMDVSENNQVNEEITDTVEYSACFPSVQLDGAAKSKPEVVFLEQCRISGRYEEISDSSGLSGLNNENIHLINCDDVKVENSDCSLPNEENLVTGFVVKMLKPTGNLEDETDQTRVSPLVTEENISDERELKSDNAQNHNRLIDNKNPTVLSGHEGSLEKTLVLQFIRNLLEETCGSISSAQHPPMNSEPQTKDSISRNVNEENVNFNTEVPSSRPMINKLPYSVIAAIPKKAQINDKGISSRSSNGRSIPVDSSKDEVKEFPTKSSPRTSVRKLVGFFENKYDSN